MPAQIRHLLQRCLEKDPKKRLRDIGDAFVELPEPERNIRRWPTAAMWLVPPAIAAAAFLVGRYTGSSSPVGPMLDRAISTRLTDYGGSQRFPALSPDGRTFAFVTDHDGTTDIWLRQLAGGEPIRLTNDPAPESDLVYAPDGDSIYFTRADADGVAIWQIGVLGGRARRIVGSARVPAPSPDGHQLAFLGSAGGDWELVVRGRDGERDRVVSRVIRGPGSQGIQSPVLGGRPGWSPDGRHLSFLRGGLFAPSNLFLIDVDSQRERQVTRFTRGNEGVQSYAWLPDSRGIVIGYLPVPRQQAPADLGILDVEDGSIVRLTMSIERGFGALGVSSDGSRLIAMSTQFVREVWRISAEGKEPPRLVLGSRGDPMWTFLTRDGRTLLFNATLSGSRNLWIRTLDEAAEPRQITFVPGDAIAHSSLSPDGSRVAFVSTASGHSDVWVQNVDGTDLRQLTNDAAADSWPVWSPDGRWIVHTSLREGGSETWRVPAAGGAGEKLITASSGGLETQARRRGHLDRHLERHRLRASARCRASQRHLGGARARIGAQPAGVQPGRPPVQHAVPGRPRS